MPWKYNTPLFSSSLMPSAVKTLFCVCAKCFSRLQNAVLSINENYRTVKYYRKIFWVACKLDCDFYYTLTFYKHCSNAGNPVLSQWYLLHGKSWEQRSKQRYPPVWDLCWFHCVQASISTQVWSFMNIFCQVEVIYRWLYKLLQSNHEFHHYM